MPDAAAGSEPPAADAASPRPSHGTRPPRPAMSDTTPPPFRRPTAPTRAIVVSRLLWAVGIGLGGLLVIFAFLYRGAQLDRLREIVVGLDPDRDPDTLDSVTQLVFWGSLGVFAAVLILEAIAVRAMMKGHGGARWALAALLVAQVAAAVLADAVVLTTGPEGPYLRLALVAGLLSAGAALVVSLTPQANAWFRPRRRPRPRRRG